MTIKHTQYWLFAFVLLSCNPIAQPPTYKIQERTMDYFGDFSGIHTWKYEREDDHSQKEIIKLSHYKHEIKLDKVESWDNGQNIEYVTYFLLGENIIDTTQTELLTTVQIDKLRHHISFKQGKKFELESIFPKENSNFKESAQVINDTTFTGKTYHNLIKLSTYFDHTYEENSHTNTYFYQSYYYSKEEGLIRFEWEDKSTGKTIAYNLVETIR